MPLIIRDQLVFPPTSLSCFRDLTLYCNVFLKSVILIEAPDPDPPWYYLKGLGGMDFVEDIVPLGREDGVRLDIEPNFPNSVITDRIEAENLHRLIARLRFAGRLR